MDHRAASVGGCRCRVLKGLANDAEQVKDSSLRVSIPSGLARRRGCEWVGEKPPLLSSDGWHGMVLIQGGLLWNAVEG